jgi:uncharacterized membrane protein
VLHVEYWAYCSVPYEFILKSPTFLTRFAGCCLFMLTLMCAPALVHAHGGDDHEHPAAAAVTAPMAPRASAQSEDFELLLVLEGRTLLLYLDQFASNEAVPHAILELSMLKNFKATAKEISAGIYSIALPDGMLVQPGKYPLEVSVQVGDSGDILTSTLELPAMSAAESDVHAQGFFSAWWLMAGALALILVVSAWFLRKRQQKLQGIVFAKGETR